MTVLLNIARELFKTEENIDEVGYEIDTLEIAAQRLENEKELHEKLLEYAGLHVKINNLVTAFNKENKK